MSDPRFLQLHSLTSYSACLLNRDDAGFAKRISFGGVTRTRISSQCLKRHWRTFDGPDSLASLGEPMSVRSRYTFDLCLRKPLAAEGVPEPVAAAVVEALAVQLLGESAKAKATKDQGAGQPALRTGQVTVLGRPEIDFLLAEARTICADVESAEQAAAAVKKRFTKDAKKNLDSLKRAAGLDAAMFGRMVTSDILSRGDAAVHVAHAFTVHEEQSESDYFTAVDDLLRVQDEDEAMGSAHLGNTELTSGLFYGYVVVDVPLLVSNLEGCSPTEWRQADRGLAADVAARLLRLVATLSPGAKLGSTAPYSYASMLLAEWGDAQPCTFANAFLSPVAAASGLLHNACRAITTHIADVDAMYQPGNRRRMACLPSLSSLLAKDVGETNASVGELSEWVAGCVRGE